MNATPISIDFTGLPLHSKSLSLTSHHLQSIAASYQTLIGKNWSLEHPVFLFDRCWLRLEHVDVDKLIIRLPPDNSAEAPELIKYNQLILKGIDHLLAIQECWLEFGIEDFHRAIRNFWNFQDKGNNGWTYKIYRETISCYRRSFKHGKPSMPLIVLARSNTTEKHSVAWISQNKSEISLVNNSTAM